MMSTDTSKTCFQCGGTFPEDAYGLTSCPSCNTFVLIDFEGHVQRPDSETAEVPEDPSPEASQPSTDPLADSQTSQDHDASTEPPESSDLEAFPSEDVSDHTDDSPTEDAFDMEDIAHHEEVEATHTPVEQASETDSGSSQLQDVVDYANSDTMDASFYYNITISGIDSKELRDSVLEALDDSRFGWTQEDMALLIKNGCLQIQKINATKMYVLMSSLKFLPVQIDWDQVSQIQS